MGYYDRIIVGQEMQAAMGQMDLNVGWLVMAAAAKHASWLFVLRARSLPNRVLAPASSLAATIPETGVVQRDEFVHDASHSHPLLR